jgi:D-alanyl-D-alanine carboxypeptidase
MQYNKPAITSKSEINLFVSLGIILALLLIASFILGNRAYRGDVSSPSKLAETSDPYANLGLTAKAAFVYDVRSDRALYSKNSEESLPLASLTKVMTALVAVESAPEHQVVTITNSAIQIEGDSGLQVGERWRLKDLLDFSLTSSSNDGVAAVAMALGKSDTYGNSDLSRESDFINSMNLKASILGMNNTHFYNETGLDQSENKSGAYGSAADMARLFAYTMKNHPELLEATKKSSIRISSLDNLIHTAENTDEIVSSIPGIKASKTGFTDIAGGNLVIAFDPEIGRPIIISVLGSTASDRFNDVSKLVEATFKALSQEEAK